MVIRKLYGKLGKGVKMNVRKNKKYFYTPLIIMAFAFVGSGCGGGSSDRGWVGAGAIPKNVSVIEPAGGFTCALFLDGMVKCVGNNFNGQLGDGTTTSRTTPAAVSGLASGVKVMYAGTGHACAITSAGGVKCWGWNLYGQLGDGTTTDRTTPVDVAGLTSGVTSIAPGGLFTCALTSSGGVKCWGNNDNGELGDGTTTSRATPVDVIGLTSGVTAISAGYYSVCALTTAGGIKCWGLNMEGLLGDGSQTDRNTPVDVIGLTSGMAAISTGENHTCALTSAGGVKCWGNYNTDGMAHLTPVDVSGLTSGVAAVSSGNLYTCALTSSGGVKCWGDNGEGQLGDGTITNRNTPVDVIGLTSGVTAISAGCTHTCAITSAGGVKCWGDNSVGQLGDGTSTDRLTPVDAHF